MIYNNAKSFHVGICMRQFDAIMRSLVLNDLQAWLSSNILWNYWNKNTHSSESKNSYFKIRVGISVVLLPDVLRWLINNSISMHSMHNKSLKMNKWVLERPGKVIEFGYPQLVWTLLLSRTWFTCEIPRKLCLGRNESFI